MVALLSAVHSGKANTFHAEGAKKGAKVVELVISER
jgi:hypothetical protein